jgi:hypothetical protein
MRDATPSRLRIIFRPPRFPRDREDLTWRGGYYLSVHKLGYYTPMFNILTGALGPRSHVLPGIVG